MRGPNAFRYNDRFKAWVNRDPRHRAAYDRLAQTWGVAALASHSDAARSYLRPPAPRLGAFVRPAPAVAAIALGAAALSVAILLESRLLPQREVLASSLGQPRRLVLADGSRLVLDADSAITPDLGRQARAVRLLRGRVRITVAPGPAPFMVIADDTLLTARDATFDVDRMDPERIDVALRQGSIEVAHAGGFPLLPPARLARLSGRQDASLRRGRLDLPARAVSARDADWTRDPLSFDRTPLGDALIEANRYSPRKIRLASPDLAGLQITGVFDPGASPELAQALAHALGLSLAPAPNGDLVLSRRTA